MAWVTWVEASTEDNPARDDNSAGAANIPVSVAPASRCRRLPPRSIWVVAKSLLAFLGRVLPLGRRRHDALQPQVHRHRPVHLVAVADGAEEKQSLRGTAFA